MIEFGGVRRRDVAGSARRAADRPTSKHPTAGTLVAIEPVAPRENVRMPGSRSSAAFLAHLIATDAGCRRPAKAPACASRRRRVSTWKRNRARNSSRARLAAL